MRELITKEFVSRGAHPEQVEVFPFMSTQRFLEFLNGVDVALDPWPYGGGTTTFQCLWMGVPVVTLAGRSAMSRNAIGPLAHAGLCDLVASDPADYVRTATELIADSDRLLRLRLTLRETMMHSPLTDGAAFTGSVERAYEAMWQRVA
jgi:predicted O-linked N-acetylglucosamine transferase (SPINDLY family)